MPVAYSDDVLDEVRAELRALDGVLVWVNPIQDGADRTASTPCCAEVADAGAWVSAHPDTILRMGTKEVLVRTTGLGWGADTHLYDTPENFRAEFPTRLAERVRVLKRERGNGGQGVWKVEVTGSPRAADGAERGAVDVVVRVQHAAQRDGQVEELGLADFMKRCDH